MIKCYNENLTTDSIVLLSQRLIKDDYLKSITRSNVSKYRGTTECHCVLFRRFKDLRFYPWLPLGEIKFGKPEKELNFNSSKMKL